MALKEFQVSNRWWDGLFGGGHTTATDPGQRGWRAALTGPGSKVLVIGRRGAAGCISVMQLSEGRLDVAIYDEATPESVASVVKGGGRALADCYRVVDQITGWSLPFIAEVENG
jgi:hypothetical protein